MNNLHIIGSNGFLGNAIKNINKENPLVLWSHSCKNEDLFFDIYERKSWDKILSNKPKNVILLSWPGLPNYDHDFHLNKNLPALISFIDELIESGLEKILIAGTCYEYGSLEGELNEMQDTDPQNFYALAKDTLRKYVELKFREKEIIYFWVRIFYPYGIGQNKNSLIPSFIRAIKNGDKEFLVGSGNLKRDFIPVKSVAMQILKIINSNKDSGIYNCGLGRPTSIFQILDLIKKEYNSDIEILERGIALRKNEPDAFWADMSKYNKTLNNI